MVSIKAVQTAIEKKDLTWKPSETPVSGEEGWEKRLGLRVEKEELAAFESAVEAANKAIRFQAPSQPPPRVDWRNNNGNWIPAVKDQGPCGSCVAFSTLTTVESRLRIASNDPSLNKDLSEAHLFFCGCGKCCGTGWNFAPALNYCKQHGVGSESSFPYFPKNQDCKAGIPIELKIRDWRAVLSVADRKDVIANKGPVIAGMEVFEDFRYYAGGIYKHASGTLVGYHAVSVIGYDDGESCWIAANSWGTGWGESGFFRIGYGECKIDTAFAFYDVDVDGVGAQTPAADLEEFKALLALAQKNPGLKISFSY